MKLVQVFKNESEDSEKCKVAQYGTEDMTVRNYPFFKPGEKKILFLYKDEITEDIAEGCYFIGNTYAGVIDIEKLDGKEVALKRFGRFWNPNPTGKEKTILVEGFDECVLQETLDIDPSKFSEIKLAQIYDKQKLLEFLGEYMGNI